MQTNTASELQQHASSDTHLRILVLVLFKAVNRASVLKSKDGQHPCGAVWLQVTCLGLLQVR